MREPGHAEPPATSVDAAETRRAVRLLAGICAVVVAIYAVIGGLVVRDDATLTAYGRRTHEIEFVSRRAEALDRDAVYGDRPVLWITGSSITRESFDAEALAARLARAGLDWGVEKYAFDRGAPLFSWAFLDKMDVRPGDHVLTTVGIDNFRTDWLRYHGNTSSHIHYLVPPRKILAVQSLPVAERIDYALAWWLWPRSFWKQRDTFRDGLQEWLVYWFDPVIDHKRPRIVEDHARQPFQTKNAIADFDEIERLKQRNVLPAEDLEPSVGQVNWDALQAWAAEVEAAGATPWVVYVPHNPKYFEHFAGPEVVARFDAAMGTLGDRYVALPQLVEREYMDYRHPNSSGRYRTTRALADVLAASERGR